MASRAATIGRARATGVAARRPRRRSARAAPRSLAALLAAPLACRIGLAAVAVLTAWAAANWVYQVARKPTELLFPVSEAFAKPPGETWRQYGPLFRQHSTA